MRHAWLAALVALLLPASALAQSADAGAGAAPAEAGEGSEAGAAEGGEAGQPAEGEGGEELPPMMRDPRQMSGIARGEQTDPPGRLTVRLVQGAMKRSEFGDIRAEFPPGGIVHLIDIDAKGKVRLISRPVDRGGRAVFDRLVANASRSYLALAVLPRPGAEDRLISRLVTMPPKVGMRMILAGEATDSQKPAIDDLINAQEQSTVTPPPAGTVVIRLSGDTKNVREVELYKAGVDAPVAKTKVEVVADQSGQKGLQARFSGIPAGADVVYYARAAGQPRPFLTLPFQLTSTQGASMSLIVAPPVLFGFHGIAMLDDEQLYVQAQILLFNPSLVPYDPGPGGLRIPLAKGYSGASINEDMSSGAPVPVKVDEDRGLVWRGPLPPGERSFVAGFGIPTSNGKATFEMPMPHGLFPGWRNQMVFDQVAGMRIQTPAGATQRTAMGNDNRPHTVIENLQVNAGTPLKLLISGLPVHPAWQRWVRYGLGALVLGLFGWALWGVATRSRGGGGRQSTLEEEREELLNEVVRLEADLRRARIGEQDYQRRRAELLRQLEGVYADLAAEKQAEQAQAGQGETRASS